MGRRVKIKQSTRVGGGSVVRTSETKHYPLGYWTRNRYVSKNDAVFARFQLLLRRPTFVCRISSNAQGAATGELVCVYCSLLAMDDYYRKDVHSYFTGRSVSVEASFYRSQQNRPTVRPISAFWLIGRG